jgi:hypothetical protein
VAEVNTPFSARKVIYAIACIAGIIFLMCEVGLFRYTIISPGIPAGIIIAVGLVAFVIDKNRYQQTYAIKGWFFPLFQNIFSWGFFACYLFVAANYYLSTGPAKSYKLKIVEVSSTNGGRGDGYKQIPTVYIDYFGFKKELIFNNDDRARVIHPQSVLVTAQKGFLGFDILTSYKPAP